MISHFDVKYNIYSSCIITITSQCYDIILRPIWWTRGALWGLILIITCNQYIVFMQLQSNLTLIMRLLLVCLCVVSGVTFGIFSFIILIVFCLIWPVFGQGEVMYTSMSTLSSMRVNVLGRFFLHHFLLLPPTSLIIFKEYFPVNVSREEVWYQWSTMT